MDFTLLAFNIPRILDVEFDLLSDFWGNGIKPARQILVVHVWAGEDLREEFRPEASSAEAAQLGVDGGSFLVEQLELALGKQSELVSEIAQAHVSVVLAEQESVLGAGCEHPVRLACAFGDKVIDQHANVRLVSGQDDWILDADSPGCVNAG